MIHGSCAIGGTAVDNTLCFGSRIERKHFLALPKRIKSYPGPFEHSYFKGLVKKLPNKRGYTLLASRTPRDKDFRAVHSFSPGIGAYDLDYKKPVKPSARPFGSGAKKLETRFITPAPGTYSFYKREVRVCTSFGHDRIIVPIVKIVCNPFNMGYCHICETTPIGDYWHKDSTNQDMCRPCLEQELYNLKKCSEKVLVRLRRMNELKAYKLHRYCGFYHEHYNTKAAVQEMPTRELTFKLRKENYLASYGL